MSGNVCTKCGAAWNAETGKYPCPKGGQCEIPAARALAKYTDTHDGQTEPSIWPPLDDEGFPF